MKRRDFLYALGSAALGWPLVSSAQQAEPMRRIGVLMPYVANDALAQAHNAAFLQELQIVGSLEKFADGRVAIAHRSPRDVGDGRMVGGGVGRWEVGRRGQPMGSRCTAPTLLLCAFVEELSTGLASASRTSVTMRRHVVPWRFTARRATIRGT